MLNASNLSLSPSESPTSPPSADDAGISEADLSLFVQGLLIVTSTLLSGFFILQKLRNRCANEVIYVSVVTVVNYSSKILSGKSLTWVTVEGGLEVPLGKS